MNFRHMMGLGSTLAAPGGPSRPPREPSDWFVPTIPQIVRGAEAALVGSSWMRHTLDAKEARAKKAASKKRYQAKKAARKRGRGSR